MQYYIILYIVTVVELNYTNMNIMNYDLKSYFMNLILLACLFTFIILKKQLFLLLNNNCILYPYIIK